MTGKQITITGGALAIVATLFYLGYKTPSGHHEEAAGIEATAKHFDFDSYLTSAKAGLGSSVKETILELEKGKTDKASLVNLARVWDSTGQKLISAHYCMELAEAEPNENNWYFAGSKFYDVARTGNDSTLQAYSAGEAQRAFEKVLSLNAQNLDAKNALAVIHVQINQDVMKGVGLLKEVVEQDSNNLQAIFTLGMLSVRSGQMDKAKQRFEKLVSLQPFNPEYYFYLGEAYAKSGEKEKAIKTYQTCLTLLKDDQAKKEVQTIINQLKTL